MIKEHDIVALNEDMREKGSPLEMSAPLSTYTKTVKLTKSNFSRSTAAPPLLLLLNHLKYDPSPHVTLSPPKLHTPNQFL
jgi:hypothetical protein